MDVLAKGHAMAELWRQARQTCCHHWQQLENSNSKNKKMTNYTSLGGCTAVWLSAAFFPDKNERR
jgi:hypothetical protein